MRDSKREPKTLADPSAAHLVLSLFPYREGTQAAVVLVRGVRPGADRLRVWSGHLPSGRPEIAGMAASDVIRLFCSEVVATLDAQNYSDLSEATDSSRGAAPAPLEGPQGEAHEQPELPLG